jgi:branched-chain amino acid transport system ATP-binding protein
MLSVRNLKASYGEIEVLHGVNFEVQKNEIVCIIGANGAGKTTTLKAIIGLLESKSAEEINFKGESIKNCKPFEVARRGISYVPEGREIFPHLTVLENLEMGGYLCKNNNSLKRNIEQNLVLFPELKKLLYRIAVTLSGGEQQMLAIARGLMANPELLLIDEPSMGLAPILIERLFNAMKQIKKHSDTSILLVEQNAHQAINFAEKGYVLEEGKIVLASNNIKQLKNDERVKKFYLGIE